MIVVSASETGCSSHVAAVASGLKAECGNPGTMCTGTDGARSGRCSRRSGVGTFLTALTFLVHFKQASRAAWLRPLPSTGLVGTLGRGPMARQDHVISLRA
jgi:hypothetical protein